MLLVVLAVAVSKPTHIFASDPNEIGTSSESNFFHLEAHDINLTFVHTCKTQKSLCLAERVLLVVAAMFVHV